MPHDPAAHRYPPRYWPIPPSFKRVQWRGQTGICPIEGCVGLIFASEEGEKVRIAINEDELRAIVDRLYVTHRGPYVLQSGKCSEMPSEAVLPQAGQTQSPDAAAIAASCGD